jgi:hypothetical protein
LGTSSRTWVAEEDADIGQGFEDEWLFGETEDAPVLVGFHELVQRSQDAFACRWHGEGGMLEFAEQSAKFFEGQGLPGDGARERVEELGNLFWREFHSA